MPTVLVAWSLGFARCLPFDPCLYDCERIYYDSGAIPMDDRRQGRWFLLAPRVSVCVFWVVWGAG